MADFSISFDEKGDIPKYLDDFTQNIKKTPFFDIRLFRERGFAFFHIKPIMFPLYYISFIIWGFGFAINRGFSFPVLLIGGIPGISYLFYNKFWYIIVMYIGKWKKGYKGKIKLE